jgi:hypothetical protein
MLRVRLCTLRKETQGKKEARFARDLFGEAEAPPFHRMRLR